MKTAKSVAFELQRAICGPFCGAISGAILMVMLTGAHAEVGGLTVTPLVGYYMYDQDLEFDHHEVYGGALGYQTSGALQFEVQYLAGSTVFSDTEFELDLEQAYLTASYHFNRAQGSHPYILVGGGRQSYSLDSGADYQDSIAVAGAGYQINFGDHFSIRPDIRALYNTDEETTTAAFMLGFQFRIGPSKPKPIPEPVPVDTDGDGIVDDKDACPGTKSGATVDDMGCELNLDIDGDGVPNDKDKCPDSATGARVDIQGCYILITEAKEIELYVTFEGGSANVSPNSYTEIRRVAEFMMEYPLTRVMLAGHTDSTGSAVFNQRLSLERANAVAALLVDHFGIGSERVETVGYGESHPLYPNDTPANRAKNRRVTATVTAMVETIQQ